MSSSPMIPSHGPMLINSALFVSSTQILVNASQLVFELFDKKVSSSPSTASSRARHDKTLFYLSEQEGCWLTCSASLFPGEECVAIHPCTLGVLYIFNTRHGVRISFYDTSLNHVKDIFLEKQQALTHPQFASSGWTNANNSRHNPMFYYVLTTCPVKNELDSTPLTSDDWGEQFSWVKDTKLHLLSLNNGKFELIESPDFGDDDFDPAQAVFDPVNKLLFFTAYRTKSELCGGRAGLIYCYNVPSSILVFDLQSRTTTKLTTFDELAHARSPKIAQSLEGRVVLVYLENSAHGAHFRDSNCRLLNVTKMDAEMKVSDARVLTSGFQTKSIFVNNNSIYCSVFLRGSCDETVVSVDISTGNVVNTKIKGCLMDVSRDDNSLLILQSSYQQPVKLIILKNDLLTTVWNGQKQEGIGKVEVWNDLQSTVLVHPLMTPRALVFFIHGGPNSVISTDCSDDLLWMISSFVSLFNCLLVGINYTGSLGQGQESIDAQMGHAGQVDVDSCMSLIKETLRRLAKSCEFMQESLSMPVILYGGSHGGFLNTWLLAKHIQWTIDSGKDRSIDHPFLPNSSSFRLVSIIIRNPVVDYRLSLMTTDIPSHVLKNAVFSNNSDYVTLGRASVLMGSWQSLYSASPSSLLSTFSIQEIESSSPSMLLFLSSADRRVSMHNGLLLARVLGDKVCKRVVFEGESHALNKPDSILKQLEAIRDFLQDNLKN